MRLPEEMAAKFNAARIQHLENAGECDEQAARARDDAVKADTMAEAHRTWADTYRRLLLAHEQHEGARWIIPDPEPLDEEGQEK